MNESNLTQVNSYCKYNKPDSDIEKTVKLMTCLVLGGFGILGNVFVIVLAVKYTVKKSLHFLIINMAVADTLFVILNLNRYIIESFRILNDIERSIAEILCKSLSFFYFTFSMETLVTLLIISIERCRITRQPVQLSRPISGKRRMALIAGSWLIPVAMDFYFLIGSQIERIGSDKVCIVKNKKLEQLLLLVITTLLILIYLSLIFLSMLTLRRISKPQAIEVSLPEVQRQQRKKRIRNAVKMVLYSLLLYSCCWVPFVISYIGIIHLKYCIDWSTLLFFTWFFLPFVNSCFSPWIYCVCLSDFRQAARRLLCAGNTPPRLERRGNSVVPSVSRTQDTHL